MACTLPADIPATLTEDKQQRCRTTPFLRLLCNLIQKWWDFTLLVVSPAFSNRTISTSSISYLFVLADVDGSNFDLGDSSTSANSVTLLLPHSFNFKSINRHLGTPRNKSYILFNCSALINYFDLYNKNSTLRAVHSLM